MPDFDTTGFGYSQDDFPGLDHGPLDLVSWFHQSPPEPARPMELEIGSGKGTFLVQHAPLHPETDFLGVEYAKAYWRHAADRARRHALPNVRLLHSEAGLFLRNYVADSTFTQVHIYFPDPWPKARHNKRRLVQAPFLELVHQKLVAHGRVRLATDHEDYFTWMEEHAAKVAHLFERLPFESAESAGEGELVGTNFERKYREEGRRFQGMILVRRD